MPDLLKSMLPWLVLLIAGIVAVVRLEGRVNVQDAVIAARTDDRIRGSEAAREHAAMRSDMARLRRDIEAKPPDWLLRQMMRIEDRMTRLERALARRNPSAGDETQEGD